MPHCVALHLTGRTGAEMIFFVTFFATLAFLTNTALAAFGAIAAVGFFLLMVTALLFSMFQAE